MSTALILIGVCVALILGSLIAVKLMKAALRLFLLAAAIGGFALVYVIFFR